MSDAPEKKKLNALVSEDFLPGESFDEWEARINPEWTEDMFKKARPSLEVLAELGITPPARGRPALSESARKKRVTIMLDQDVIEHFKKTGKGWQTRANAALRKAAGLPQK